MILVPDVLLPGIVVWLPDTLDFPVCWHDNSRGQIVQHEPSINPRFLVHLNHFQNLLIVKAENSQLSTQRAKHQENDDMVQ
jgi:hypothetical protein